MEHPEHVVEVEEKISSDDEIDLEDVDPSTLAMFS
jgi:hypothetical protein